MKKILIILLAVFPLVFSSCKKDDHQPGTLTGTLEGFMDKDTKVLYDPSNSDSPFSWQDGDLITVFRSRIDGSYGSNGNNWKGTYMAEITTDNAKAEFSLNGNITTTNNDVTDDEVYTGNYWAAYPSSCCSKAGSTNQSVGNLTFTASNVYRTDANYNLLGNPMFAVSATKQLHFKHIFGLLRLRLEKDGANIIAVKISSNSKRLNGDFTLKTTNSGPSITPKTNPNASQKQVWLYLSGSLSLDNQKTLFIPLPTGDYSNLVIELVNEDGQKCVKTQQTGTLHISRAMYSTITLGENDLSFEGEENVTGAKKGLFSIGLGKWVRFSKGNLQYLAAATGDYANNTWRFAENQYDVCAASANLAPSSTSTNWIDMFGWGTSGHSGSNPYNYLQTVTYGPASGGFNTANQEYDWGHNAIINGGNTADMWRTLTNSEWDYVISKRANASSLWALAKVGTQRGLILLPDTWSDAGEPQHRGSNSSWTVDANKNEYTLDEWNVLDRAGAVFLPQCGYRSTNANGTSMEKANLSTTSPSLTQGSYWTSQRNGTGKPNKFYFTGQPYVGSNTSNNYEGHNVRLVHDVQ